MSSVVDWLASIGESISNVSREIVNSIGEFFSTLFSYLNPFSENFILNQIIDFFVELLSYLNPFNENFILKILFEWISDLLHNIFVPDTEKIRSDFNSMLNDISSSFGLSFSGVNEFSNQWQEKPAESIEENYNIYGVGTLKLKFFDNTYLIQGVERFRPLIRGFVVFLLILYNYYQILTFIGQDPKIMATAEKEYQSFINRKEK